MATIQVRDVPDDAYETIRRRARREGQSIQAYMRERVVEMAGRPTKAEAVAAIEAALARSGGAGTGGDGGDAIAADVAADRR